MTTYTSEGIEISPFTPTVTRVPVTDDLPTVTVQGRFDWQFWFGLAVAGGALWILSRSLKHASRHG